MFSGEGKSFVLGLDKLGKLKKVKEAHCSRVISGISRFQVTSTIFYEDKKGTLAFLDTPEQSPDTWRDLVIAENLGNDSYWSAGGSKLMIVRQNSADSTPKLCYYSNVFSCLQPDSETELNFEVKSMTVAKECFYILSSRGQLYQGEYSRMSVKKIS